MLQIMEIFLAAQLPENLLFRKMSSSFIILWVSKVGWLKIYVSLQPMFYDTFRNIFLNSQKYWNIPGSIATAIFTLIEECPIILII